MFYFLFSNCKKDYEVAPSGQYFPSYANSYWDYLNENGDIVRTYTTSFKISFKCRADNYEHTLENSHYTTNFKGNAAGIHNQSNVYNYKSGYFDNRTQNPNAYYCKYFMSEKIGQSWRVNSCSQTNDVLIVKEVMAKETISDLSSFSTDPFIIIKQSYGTCYFGQVDIDSTLHYEYYAKDIGLVKKVRINHPQGDTLVTLLLQDYKVNN